MSLRQNLHEKIKLGLSELERFIDRPWYVLIISFLAFIDSLIVIVPTDGILISSIFLCRQKWLRFSVGIAIGSTLGGLLLAWLVQAYGMDLILYFSPDLESTRTWQWTESFFDNYGLIVLFVVAATPVFQHPAVILAALSGNRLGEIALVCLLGRLLKFLIMGYVASHAPRLLSKMWGVQAEMKEVGIDPSSKS